MPREIIVDNVSRASSTAPYAVLGQCSATVTTDCDTDADCPASESCEGLTLLELGNSSTSTDVGAYSIDSILVLDDPSLSCWDLIHGTCSVTTAQECYDDADCPASESCEGVVNDTQGLAGRRSE
jgi:hypothetical protein